MMESRHKRLAAAKKKLQEYKNQKSKHENPEVDIHANQPMEEYTGIEIAENISDYGLDATGSDTSIQPSADTGVVMDDIRVQNSFVDPQDIRNGSPIARIQELQCVEIKQPFSVENEHIDTPNENCTIPQDEIRAKEIVSTVSSVPQEEKETQCESDENVVDDYMKESLADLQNELSKVRSENSKLFHREMELVQQLETSEKVIRDLRKEVNHFKEQGHQLHQLEDMQQAVTILSKSKVALAEQLSNEQDRTNQLLETITGYDNQVQGLKKENNQLRLDINSMKSRLEEALIQNQLLEDQRRHFGSQIESLETKLSAASETSSDHGLGHRNGSLCYQGGSHDTPNGSQDFHVHSDSEAEVPDGKLNNCDTGSQFDQPYDHSEHDHSNHSCGDHHEATNHTHKHGEVDHGHDPHHSTNVHASDSSEIKQQLKELEKTLKRLQWENRTYEEELVKLGPLKHMEPRVRELEERNRSLQQEVDRLEHLVIQLQGENDTIGDYITLYQTQKLALREHAKENEILVETLSRERNELLLKLSELNLAVEKLAEKKCGNNEETGLETQIRDLIHNVNTKVHEPYSCSVCSGSRMMTV